MLALRRSEQLRARIFAIYRKYLATQSQPAIRVQHANETDEYTEQPEYPEIKDLTFKARKEDTYKEWHEEIRQLNTVEEKLIKINMPRYYGYHVVEITDDKLRYNVLPALQHYTRTVVEQTPVSSVVEGQSPEQLDALVSAVKGEVQDVVEYAHDILRCSHPDPKQLDPMEYEQIVTQAIVEQINRTLTNGLIADCQHLQDVDVDFNARHEAFWAVGGINPPKNVKKSKEGRDWQKDMANDPVDRWMQYIGRPYISVRHQNQLPPWKSESEVESLELAKQIPRYNYDPRTLGYSMGHRHGTNIPGYWPSGRTSFGCISYQSRAPLLIKPTAFTDEDVRSTLDAFAIQSSYAWLLGQANYNGFNTFNDLTYPMNTQTIITNGRTWSFYEYQLNTLLVHTRHIDENPRINYCRGTDELDLYKEIDDKGKLIGFNDQVVRHLVQFYANAPTVQRTGIDLQPYLNPECKRIADYTNEEKREFLERTFKHMTTNKPRHLALPEIYLWEKFYKIDNKTRQLEARRRYFELDINPWKRTLDQHQKEYIPRALRPDGTKSKKKFKPTYYP